METALQNILLKDNHYSCAITDNCYKLMTSREEFSIVEINTGGISEARPKESKSLR